MFEDIRPYSDAEVPEALSRVTSDPEFWSSMTAFLFSGYPGWLRSLLQPIIKFKLKRKLKNVRSVHELQIIIERYLDDVIEEHTTQLVVQGLDKLDKNKPYLFISNHRDIVMDPAMLNYALYHNGFDTARIAIGDNLLQKPFASDLMRLNKSFIVKRSTVGVKEKLKTYMALSGYIDHSIREGSTVWIAQREGRAKDGLDITDPAIIKMLYMSKRNSGIAFPDYINSLHIVPVTIAYEWNPCDAMIAEELRQKDLTGSYQKSAGEDLRSIVQGITGEKGAVTVVFGTPLSGKLEKPEDVARAIDEQMIQNYHLHSSHYAAAHLLTDSSNPDTVVKEVTEEALERFKQRLSTADASVHTYLLQMYANAVIRRHAVNPSA